MVDRECMLCKKLFSIRESQIKHGKGRYCSVSCAAKAGGAARQKMKIHIGEENPNWKNGRSSDPYNSYVRRYKENNPEKVRVQRLIRNEYRSGRLKKSPCIVCGSNKSEAHHEDYLKPYNITWLCRKHHNERHSEQRIDPALDKHEGGH